MITGIACPSLLRRMCRHSCRHLKDKDDNVPRTNDGCPLVLDQQWSAHLQGSAACCRAYYIQCKRKHTTTQTKTHHKLHQPAHPTQSPFKSKFRTNHIPPTHAPDSPFRTSRGRSLTVQALSINITMTERPRRVLRSARAFFCPFFLQYGWFRRVNVV